MSDLIRREDVIEAIFSKPAWHGSDGSWYHSDDIRDAIGSTPSARPKGEWIKRTHNTLIAQVNFAYCSECGQPIMHEHTRPLWNFCPNCGADMREREGE